MPFGYAGLLGQLAKDGLRQIFTLINSALRHLPPVAFARVDPLSDKDFAVLVDQHDADAGSIFGNFGQFSSLSINFMAAKIRSRSACVLGTAWRKLVKLWVTPSISIYI